MCQVLKELHEKEQGKKQGKVLMKWSLQMSEKPQ
jgi:hypothetical protein